MIRRLTAYATILVLLAGAFTLAVQAEEKETLPVLRRKLLEARDDLKIGEALDKLAARISEGGLFASHEEFGDWLGNLPDGREKHAMVKQRRGWAYLSAGKGEKALPLLQAALKVNPGSGVTRAYLGEALRQVKKPKEAMAMFTKAVECGYHKDHLHQSVLRSIWDLRAASIPGHADDLPEYVLAAEAYLKVRPEASIHDLVAANLLEDYQTYEKPDRARGKRWALAAARHALTGIRITAGSLRGQAKLAYDAAVALERLDKELQGATLRFDLLSWAHRLGRDPQGDNHQFPQVLTWLAEGAAAEGRFEHAYHLASRRLEISNSPRARRLLMRLPPDLGDEED